MIALPLAWLTTRTDLRGRFVITLLSILPLAIPGYVVGYALLGIGAPQGPFSSIFGVQGLQLSGFVGAALALVIYNFPLVYFAPSHRLREPGSVAGRRRALARPLATTRLRARDDPAFGARVLVGGVAGRPLRARTVSRRGESDALRNVQLRPLHAVHRVARSYVRSVAGAGALSISASHAAYVDRATRCTACRGRS